jgi:glycosyltransferase involved in cell wall biosynthesis
VWVITRKNNRQGIDATLASSVPDAKQLKLHFVYYDLPKWARWWKRGGRGVHLYYILWQWFAYKKVVPLHVAIQFDAIHHITFGVIRHPTFMGRLSAPLLLGPLGGGEHPPHALTAHLPFKGRLKERLRSVANRIAKYDPFVRQMYARATLIFMKAQDSLDWLPPKFQSKAQCLLEIGIDPKPLPASLPRESINHVLKLLYVGRFIGFKGMGLGLQALAKLKNMGVDAELTMIGKGPERKHWEQLANILGIAEQVGWVEWMPQDELLAAYSCYDALLFPSLHDSSGNVVLEAMAGGLPVVCLDLGGPAEIVDNTSGLIVDVNGKTESAVVDALASALKNLSADTSLRTALKEGALIRAQQFNWPLVIGKVWGEQGIGYQAVMKAQSAPNRGTL